MSTQVFECPKCGAQQPEVLANGAKLFNCKSCGQVIHPPKCNCPECDMRQLEAELKLGLAGLAGIKAVRREDEARRLAQGLPPSEKFGNTGLVIIDGEVATKCHNCGLLCTKKFCPNCGHQVAGACPRCVI